MCRRCSPTASGAGARRWRRSSAASPGATSSCGSTYTVADLALYGYVHVADDAGCPLDEHPGVASWVRRVAALPGFEEGLTPMPAHASRRTL